MTLSPEQMAAPKPLSRSKWLAMRSKALGGTDVAAIAGLDNYRTAIDCFNEKTGKVPPVEANALMERGRVLEHVVARMYSQRTGRKIQKTPVVVHPDYDFLMGTPDRAIVDGTDVTTPGLLEVKTHGLSTFEKVREEGIYPAHVCQLQWYMGLGGFSWGSYAIFNADKWDLITFDVEADPQFFASLLALAVDFWQKYVIPNVPPPLPSAPLVVAPKVGGDAKVIDDADVVSALAIYADAKRVADEAQSALDGAKDNLKSTLPGLGSYKLPGATVNYTSEPGRRTIDKAAMIAHGLDPATFERVGEPFQTFKVFLKKERK